MDNLPPFSKADRLLILAPHPDDESLATGGLLQRAAQAGIATRIVFLTDGDNNPWPQRVIERRWRVSGERERTRWGALRRAEASSALSILRHDPAEAEFWALPDQGLTGLLLSGGNVLLEKLCHAMIAWRPSHLAAPSTEDRHPDHSALGVALGMALRRIAGADQLSPPAVLSYIVHGNPNPGHQPTLGLRLDATETGTKRQAILCHRSQVLLSRRRFLSHAKTEELFLGHPATEIPAKSRLLRVVCWDEDGLRIDFRASLPSHFLGALKVHLLVESEEKPLRHICLPVRARGGRGTMLVPPTALGQAAQRVFVKLENTLALYASSGWAEQKRPGSQEPENPPVCPAAVPRKETGKRVADSLDPADAGEQGRHGLPVPSFGSGD